jgi:adenylate cyclase
MERKLAAIFSTDVKGYSRLMGDDEEATILTLKTYREVITILIEQHHGRVVDSPGDNMLAEFASAVDAVKAAVAIQHELSTRNAELEAHRRMEFRIGLNVGDVISDEGRLYGDGVNIAARLEGLADPGGICISGTVHDYVENKLDMSFSYQGEQTVKNIAKPVRVYKVELDTERLVPRAVKAPSPALPLREKPSIAVLPFTNMSNDPEQEYFSDGMTEDIITDLAKISGLFVIARNSSFTYKGQTVKVEQVGQELGVRYVVEGSIRKAGTRVRISAQLIDATTGGHVWAERYNRELTDIFALQDDVTQQIVTALQVKLTAGEQERRSRAPTANMAAYDYYWRGVEYYYRRTQEANAQARELFTRAIDLDGRFAAAYALLGRTYLTEWAVSWSNNPQSVERAAELVHQAVSFDDASPMAHLALGFVYVWQKQYDHAIAEAQQAIALNPNDAEGYAALGDILNYAGRPAEVRDLMEQAMRLDPHYPAEYLSNIGRAYFLLGQHEEAIAILRRVVIRNPDYGPAHVRLTILYSELGRAAEAQAELAAVVRIYPLLSLEHYRRAPYKDPAVIERYMNGLRKAGLK